MVPVDLIDHRCQGGGLTAAGGTSDQNQAIFAPQ